MVPKLIIEEIVRSEKEINEPITKFGGQPVWITEPEWPISIGWDDRPMMFICQIALDNKIFKNGNGKMAYIFVTHGNKPNDEFFDPDIIFPFEGENAVIIQPGDNQSIKTKRIEKGPSLFDNSGIPYEAYVRLKYAEDPDFIDASRFRGLSDYEKRNYSSIVNGNKIGGTPYFFQGDEWPEGTKIPLLMQLNPNFLPFYLNLGASPTAFAFIEQNLASGMLLIQDM